MKEFKAPMVQDYRTEIATVIAPTTDKTGATTTNLVKLCEAGANQSKLSAIHFKCQGDSVAATGLIFLRKATGDYVLFDEVVLSPTTSSATERTAMNFVLYDDMPLEDGVEVFVGVTALSGTVKWNAFAIIADYKEAV
jgi:hypothetical protein